MSERSAEQIRQEIEAERLSLGEDIDVMKVEARKVALVAAGVVAASITLKLLWKLR